MTYSLSNNPVPGITDPHPSFHIDADPDPTFNFDADPDADPDPVP